MTINTRVTELFATIASANAELEVLRKTCAHTNYYIGWWSWRLGNQEPAKICNDCRYNIGRPSQKEVNIFMAAEKARRATFLRETNPPEIVEMIERDCPFQDYWSHEEKEEGEAS